MEWVRNLGSASMPRPGTPPSAGAADGAADATAERQRPVGAENGTRFRAVDGVVAAVLAWVCATR
jgi:hypothetical protein